MKDLLDTFLEQVLEFQSMSDGVHYTLMCEAEPRGIVSNEIVSTTLIAWMIKPKREKYSRMVVY